MSYKTKRSRACDIPQDVKRRVHDRDRGACIFCGRPGDPVAHVIPRSHGGLGIEQNIVSACAQCHEAMDNGIYRRAFIETAKRYLRGIYGDKTMDTIDLTYRKGRR